MSGNGARRIDRAGMNDLRDLAEQKDVIFYDDIAYDPEDSGGRNRMPRPVMTYRRLPVPPGGPGALIRLRPPRSRLDCLKAALRNFF